MKIYKSKLAIEIGKCAIIFAGALCSCAYANTSAVGTTPSEQFSFSTSTQYNGFTDNWPSTWSSYFGVTSDIESQKPTGDISAYGFKDSTGNTVSKVSGVYVAAIPFRYALKKYGDRHDYINGVINSSQGSNSDNVCYLAQQLPSATDFNTVNIEDNKKELSTDTADSNNPVYLIVPNQFCGGNSWVKDQQGIPGAQDVQNSCSWINSAIDDKDKIATNCENNSDSKCNAFCSLATGEPSGSSDVSWPTLTNNNPLMEQFIKNGSCNPGVGLIHSSQSIKCINGTEPACFKYNNNPNILKQVDPSQTSNFGSQCLNKYTIGTGQTPNNTYNNWCSGANMHFDFQKGDISKVYRIKAVPCNVAGNINVGTIM